MDERVLKKIKKLNRAIQLSTRTDLILLTALAFIECENRGCCDEVYKLKDSIKKQQSKQ